MTRIVNRAGWVLAVMLALLVVAALAGVVRGARCAGGVDGGHATP